MTESTIPAPHPLLVDVYAKLDALAFPYCPVVPGQEKKLDALAEALDRLDETLKAQQGKGGLTPAQSEEVQAIAERALRLHMMLYH